MPDIDGSGESLQFDHAEFEGGGEEAGAAPAVPCSGCGRSIADSYYKVNYEIVCHACYANALALHAPGGAAGRFFRAVLFGLAAGAAGAALYYAILALTGYQLSLIAIVVGFLVGAAVKIGSHRRGGWLYQALAMVITYVAITSTYVPFVLEEISSGIADANLQTGAPEPGTGAVDEAVSDRSDASDGSDASDAPRPAAEDLGAAGRVLLLIVAFVVALIAPFLAGSKSLLVLIIIGIGLYEAWKLNQRQPFATEGPFQVGAQPA